MTRNEAINLLQEVLEYQTSRGQRIVWFTDDNVKRFIEVLKHSDSECENCASAIEDRVNVIRCKDCKWYDERISMCDNCGLPREQIFFCADGERKET